MRRLTLGLALAVSSLLPTAGAAQAIEQMLPACELAASGRAQDLEDIRVGYCFGVAAGMRIALAINCYGLRDGSAAPDVRFAADMPSSNQAAVQGWLNWIRANPARWGDPFEVSFIQAMAETFPCTR